MTRWAPHLTAPRNLENHLSAPRTPLGVLFQKTEGLYRPGVTHVTAIPCLAAVFAKGHLAQRTVPVRQKTTAVGCWTLSGLFGFGGRLFPNLKTQELSGEFGLIGTLILKQTVDFLDSKSTIKFDLSLGEQTLLAFKEDFTVMRLQRSVDKGFGHGQVQELSVPGLSAPHAVWVETALQEVPSRAGPTLGQVAVATLNRFAVGPVKAVAADRALFRHFLTRRADRT